jgi:hypothetical protein
VGICRVSRGCVVTGLIVPGLIILVPMNIKKWEGGGGGLFNYLGRRRVEAHGDLLRSKRRSAVDVNGERRTGNGVIRCKARETLIFKPMIFNANDCASQMIYTRRAFQMTMSLGRVYPVGILRALLGKSHRMYVLGCG